MQTRATTWNGRLLIPLLVIFSMSSMAVAQDDNPVRERINLAWQQANMLLDGVLNPKQQSELNTLAYSTAVANLCEDFALNQENFEKGFNYLAHDELADMNAEEIAYFERHLHFNYGVAVGLFLAEGAANPSSFCEQAATHQGEAEYHYWR